MTTYRHRLLMGRSQRLRRPYRIRPAAGAPSLALFTVTAVASHGICASRSRTRCGAHAAPLPWTWPGPPVGRSPVTAPSSLSFLVPDAAADPSVRGLTAGRARLRLRRGGGAPVSGFAGIIGRPAATLRLLLPGRKKTGAVCGINPDRHAPH
jgi:hypothetical protein